MKIPTALNYDITEQGIVTNTLTGLQLKISTNANYKVCYIWLNDGTNKLCYLHRLLAITFIPNPDNKPVVNHKDSNKLNNSIDNLEWVTYQENSVHSLLSKNISEQIHCKTCNKPFIIAVKREAGYCSRECYNISIRKPSITKFVELGNEFVTWAINNYPFTYLSVLCCCSDVGLRKRLKSIGYECVSKKTYSSNRPNSLEELYSLYATVAQ